MAGAGGEGRIERTSADTTITPNYFQFARAVFAEPEVFDPRGRI